MSNVVFMQVLHICFSHNGKRLASGSKDTSVIVWDTEDINDVRKHRVLHGHPFSVAWVAWSPDDKYIVACGEDESSEVYVWTAEVRGFGFYQMEGVYHQFCVCRQVT